MNILKIVFITFAAFLYVLWPFAVLVLLIIKKQWTLAIVFVVAGILYQTLRYRNKDIFANDCENDPWDEIGGHLNDDEWMEAMFIGNGCPFTEEASNRSFNGQYAILWSKHHCVSNPIIFYSTNGKYKATVYHTYWKNYWLWQMHGFTIIYDRS